MKIPMILFLITASFVCCQSTSTRNTTLTQGVVLVKSSPGGSRAHIIELEKDGVYRYWVGEFKDDNLVFLKHRKQDAQYEEQQGQLSSDEIASVEDIIKRYSDPSKVYESDVLIKDAWQYHIYIDNKRVLKIYESELVRQPKDIQELVRVILQVPRKLYELPGFS